MAATLTLKSDNSELVIELAINEQGWSRCYLSGEKPIFMGAETAKRLLPKLLKAVADEMPASRPVEGFFEGCTAFWVLTLAEAHHVLYVAQDGTDRLLFWLDAHQEPPTIVATLRLSPTQRRQWQADLWDWQIEEDAPAGKLDALAQEANREFEAGRCHSL